MSFHLPTWAYRPRLALIWTASDHFCNHTMSTSSDTGRRNRIQYSARPSCGACNKSFKCFTITWLIANPRQRRTQVNCLPVASVSRRTSMHSICVTTMNRYLTHCLWCRIARAWSTGHPHRGVSGLSDFPRSWPDQTVPPQLALLSRPQRTHRHPALLWCAITCISNAS